MPKSKKAKPEAPSVNDTLDIVGVQFANTLKNFMPTLEQQLNAINVEEIIEKIVTVQLANTIQELTFPDKSIPSKSIDYSAATIPAKAIGQGTISQFNSTGIEDLAHKTQLTIMDNMIVAEKKLVAGGLDIKGDAVISGNLLVQGDIPLDGRTMQIIIGQVVKQVKDGIMQNLDERMETISGDIISGGSITNFSSTGIEDRASNVQLTIMDEIIVFENKLIAKELEIKGNTIIDGNLLIKGDMPLDEATTGKLVDETTQKVYGKIAETLKEESTEELLKHFTKHGIEASNLTIKGRDIILNDDSLAPNIRNSKLITVGRLKELVVTGEAKLSGSLYTTHSRVGINTDAPSAALSIWDSEVEILAGKLRDHTSYIGSMRRQDVVLGAGKKENITLGADGHTTIKQLIAHKTPIASSATEPNVKGEKGAVVFNMDPSLGAPWGWMCLGGAVWAEMGKLK